MTKKQMLKALAGTEVWTSSLDRFDERVCVGILEDGLMEAGVKFMPTKKEMLAVWRDVMESEGINAEIKEMDREMGKLRTLFGEEPELLHPSDKK